MTFYLDYERISHHQSMLSDVVRTTAFRRAIERRVRPGDVVVDLGAGTGILSLFAQRAGARKVYAIERTALVGVAREIARINGADGIKFLHADSSGVVLPEMADVLVSECLGYCALQENMIADLLSLRSRVLRPGGAIIPRAVNVYVALISKPALRKPMEFWTNIYGFDFSPLSAIAINSVYQLAVRQEELASVAHRLVAINCEADTAARLDREVRLVWKRAATVHGLCGFFRAALGGGVVLTNAPGIKTHWKTQCFPFRRPLKGTIGDWITVRIKAEPRTGAVDWIWETEYKGERDSYSTVEGIRLKEQPGARRLGG